MPGVSTPDQIVREDLSDLYLQSDVRKTPVTSRIKKGEKLKNFLFSWAIEKMDGRQVAGIPEGKDVDAFESDKQYRLWNRAQKFWRTPMSTTEANEVNAAPADFGKYVKQVNKKTMEQQRDVEVRLLDDQDSRDDNGTIGSQFKGLGMVINDGIKVGSSGAALTQTDGQTTIPSNFMTPSAQIYVGNLIDVNGAAVFNDDALLTMLQSRYDSLGQTTELVMYADSVLKRHMSKFFGKMAQNVQGYTTVVRSQAEAVAAKEYALYGVDIINTDFGPMMIELMQWAPKLTSDGITPSGRGYILNLDQLNLRPNGRWMTHRELENRGAGPRGLIESIIGYEYGDPRTHCKVDPVAVQGS